MICLPAAVLKAMFDLLWDFFRHKTIGIADGVESGIELHHTNETLPRPEPNGFVQTSQSEPALAALETSGDVLSLGSYLKEKFNESKLRSITDSFVDTFPIFSGTLRRLPYALLPFALSQFILVEALSYTGWISVFSQWLAIVVGFSLPATVFTVGVVSVILCNCSGTNIGATILLVKVLKHPNFAERAGIPPKLRIGGMLALAMGSNIGAVSFTFSASLAGISLSNYFANHRFTLACHSTAKGNKSDWGGVCKVEYVTVVIHDCCGVRHRVSRGHGCSAVIKQGKWSRDEGGYISYSTMFLVRLPKFV